MTKQTEQLAKMFETTRAATLELFDVVAAEEHLHQSPGGGFRPIIWHLAHIGVFEAYWILQQVKGDAAPDARYERIFDPIATPRENSVHLPTRREMEDYLARVRRAMLAYLEEINFNESASPLLRDNYIFHLVLEHERQHQETLAYLLHMLDPARKRQPLPHGKQPAPSSPSAAARDMVTIPAGEFQMGAPWKMFVYDNELPAHTRFLPEFKIDRLPTTNKEYAHFIREGGYERREWWSAEGWEWRERENWTCPLYWSPGVEIGQWRARTMFGEDEIKLQHPVAGVSWHEAEAYARFVNKRLPTEAEWEKAASWDAEAHRKRLFAWGDEEPSPAYGNFNLRHWDTTPVGSFPAGASAYGCLDMTGNVWEWTSDSFAGYENFTAYPYPEYSETWFDGDHRVLKGGSWATHPALLRTSFRNFFRRQFRIAFSGIRCAADS